MQIFRITVVCSSRTRQQVCLGKSVNIRNLFARSYIAIWFKIHIWFQNKKNSSLGYSIINRFENRLNLADFFRTVLPVKLIFSSFFVRVDWILNGDTSLLLKPYAMKNCKKRIGKESRKKFRTDSWNIQPFKKKSYQNIKE
jgi:hypothetical protein